MKHFITILKQVYSRKPFFPFDLVLINVFQTEMAIFSQRKLSDRGNILVATHFYNKQTKHVRSLQ